mmetsp:Transcript_4997/g.9400  ORF Transcript_4997/g.9400 Transcript_4997/m.9400 type:complete len:214 (-) Transcript_4997:1065-1706(-)
MPKINCMNPNSPIMQCLSSSATQHPMSDIIISTAPKANGINTGQDSCPVTSPARYSITTTKIATPVMHIATSSTIEFSATRNDLHRLCMHRPIADPAQHRYRTPVARHKHPQTPTNTHARTATHRQAPLSTAKHRYAPTHSSPPSSPTSAASALHLPNRLRRQRFPWRSLGVLSHAGLRAGRRGREEGGAGCRRPPLAPAGCLSSPPASPRYC